MDDLPDPNGNLHRTPLEHLCECVIDWGCDTDTSAPYEFIDWFLQIVLEPCPWHTLDIVGNPKYLELDELPVSSSHAGKYFLARRASGTDIELGRRLAKELKRVIGIVSSHEPQAILDEVPDEYRRWLLANNPEPVDGWLNLWLAEIVVNRGQRTPDEVANDYMLEVRRIERAGECRICQFSAANGGLLCDGCGHDWACHPTKGGQEPCSHCSCVNMQM